MHSTVISKIKSAIKKDRRELHLGSTELTSLPTEIGQLKKLTRLYLDVNQLKCLPTEFTELNNLEILDLCINLFICLPAEITELKKLKKLYLSFNQLKSLPAEIATLKNLEGLNLYHNQLESIPAKIGQLENLKELDLSYNQLTSIPAEIALLKNLTILNLGHNMLTSLPPEIAELKKLKKLYLTGNNINHIPDKYLTQQIDDERIVKHNGKMWEVDYDGFRDDTFFLANKSDEDWYDFVRNKDGIPELTSEHREVLEYYQTFFRNNGLAPIPRTRRKDLNLSDRSIRKLFPSKNPYKTIHIMAGLPRPITY